MTYNEIMQRLEYKSGEIGVQVCIDHDLLDKAIDLINRKQTEIEELKQKIDFLYELKDRLKAEIEALQFSAQQLSGFLTSAKSETIKEFAERLKEIVDGDINRIYALGGIGGAVAPLCKFKDDIDNLVKEMTEQRKEDEKR